LTADCGWSWDEDDVLGRTAMIKIPTEYLKYLWPMRHYLVTSGGPDQANIIAVSFCMPVAKEPPMLACAIGRRAYSSELIRASGELVVNVPTQGMKREIYYCGFHSGRDVDKFKETGLTPHPARLIAVPIIKECVAHLECRLDKTVGVGDKLLFVAAVIEAYADEDVEQGRRILEHAAGDFPVKVYGTRYPDKSSKD
jgi:flavin reductase (DIM6/NTAB) family NADH-FMN oxidoreductase RutF